MRKCVSCNNHIHSTLWYLWHDVCKMQKLCHNIWMHICHLGIAKYEFWAKQLQEPATSDYDGSSCSDPETFKAVWGSPGSPGKVTWEELSCSFSQHETRRESQNHLPTVTILFILICYLLFTFFPRWVSQKFICLLGKCYYIFLSF